MYEFQGNLCKRSVKKTNTLIYEVMLKGSIKRVYGTNFHRYVQESNEGVTQMGRKENKAQINHKVVLDYLWPTGVYVYRLEI